MFSEDFPKGQQRTKPSTITGVLSCSSTTSQRTQAFPARTRSVVSVRIDIRGPSTPGVPSPRREREDRLILNGLSAPRDRSTGSNPESTLQALATKVGSSDELASELPQGRGETKASTEHSIEILAGIDQRRLTETSYPRFRIRLKPRSIAEDFSVNESLRRAFIVLTSSQSIALYYRNINTTTTTDLRCVSRHCEPKSGSYSLHLTSRMLWNGQKVREF